MATSIAELQAKFTADVGQLQASVNSAFSGVERVVNKTVSEVSKSFQKLNQAGTQGVLDAQNLNKIQSGFEALGQAGKKQLDELSGAAKTSGKAIETTSKSSASLKKGLGDVAQVAQVFGRTMGGAAGEAVFAVSAVANQTRELSLVLAGVGSSGALLAFGALVGGLVAYKEWTKASTDATKAFSDELERNKKLLDIQRGAASARASGRASVAAVGADPSLAGKPLDQAKATVSALEGTLGELRGKLAEAIQAESSGSGITGFADGIRSDILSVSTELEKARAALAGLDAQAKQSTALEEVIANYGAAISRSIASLDLFGNRHEEIKSRIDLTKGAILDLISNGISPQDEHVQALVRTYGELQTAMQQVEEQKRSSDAALADQKATEDAWKGLVNNFRQTQAEILTSLSGLVNNFINGIAGAIAAAAIYGASFADLMTNVFAAAAQQLIQLALKSFIELIAIAISLIVVDNFRAYASIPFVGLALGAAGAVAAVAAARSTASSKGGHAFAEGGIVTGPMLGLVGEAGNEAIIPLDRLNEFIADRPGNKSPDIYLDGFLMTSIIARILPKYLKHKGVA